MRECQKNPLEIASRKAESNNSPLPKLLRVFKVRIVPAMTPSVDAAKDGSRGVGGGGRGYIS